MGNKLRTIIRGKIKNNIIGIVLLIVVLIFMMSSINEIFGREAIIINILMITLLIVDIVIDCYDRRKFLANTTESQGKIIENELQNVLVHCEYNYVLTDNYIFKLNRKRKVIEYKDVVMMYTKLYFPKHSIDKYLIIVTKEGKYEFLISTTLLTINYEPKNFEDIIIQKNPNVLCEKTKENIHRIKEKYNIDIK